jgi:PKD repeat protein
MMCAAIFAVNPVGAPPPYGPPVADWSANPTSVPVFNNIDFTDMSTGNPTSWQWLIDGSLWSIAQNPSYYFTSAGFYSIELIVENAYGTDSYTASVEVVN